VTSYYSAVGFVNAAENYLLNICYLHFISKEKDRIFVDKILDIKEWQFNSTTAESHC
jgi:hypothetical protein